MPSKNPKKKSSEDPISKPGRSKNASPVRTLKPLRGVVWIDKEGLHNLAIAEMRPERVGWKAYGLSSLPSEWVPRFLVLDAKCLKDTRPEQTLREHLAAGMAEIGLQGDMVMVRSSG